MQGFTVCIRRYLILPNSVGFEVALNAFLRVTTAKSVRIISDKILYFADTGLSYSSQVTCEQLSPIIRGDMGKVLRLARQPTRSQQGVRNAVYQHQTTQH